MGPCFLHPRPWEFSLYMAACMYAHIPPLGGKGRAKSKEVLGHDAARLSPTPARAAMAPRGFALPCRVQVRRLEGGVGEFW